MNIYELVNKYINAGYSDDDAIPKVAQDIILLHYFTVSHVQVFNLHAVLHGRYYLHLQTRKLRLREIRLLIPKHTRHKCQKQGCQAPHPVFASHSRLPWAVPLPAAYNVLKIF